MPSRSGAGCSEDCATRYFVARPRRLADSRRDPRHGLVQEAEPDGGFLGRWGNSTSIFCRNVAIYFNEPDRISLFGRLGRALDQDGYLVIGAMESLNGICPQFESKRHLRSAFYQSKPDCRRREAPPAEPRMLLPEFPHRAQFLPIFHSYPANSRCGSRSLQRDGRAAFSWTRWRSQIRVLPGPRSTPIRSSACLPELGCAKMCFSTNATGQTTVEDPCGTTSLQ